MASKDESSNADTAVLEREYLPVVAYVIEGELLVPLDYSSGAAEADTIFAGFQYLLLKELRQREPALMRLYDLEFYLEEVTEGSRKYRWKIIARLKKRVSDTLGAIRKTAKPEVVIALVGLVLATPPAIESVEHLLRDHAVPAVEQQLRKDNPHAPPNITIIIVRPPEPDEQSGKYQGPGLPGES